jgi:isopentenyl-diphosphate delta-isomerase
VNTKGYLEAIENTTQHLDLPIMVKETGAGISGEDARALEKAGAAAIDVAGAGGTSWAAVETYRSEQKHYGELFWDWGIPTAISTIEVSQSVSIPVISSGGIRNGIDAVKALALGAEAVGMALPILKSAYKGQEYLEKFLEQFLEELRVTMFLVGASNLEELRKKDLIITGKTREWLEERSYNTKIYARRSSP